MEEILKAMQLLGDALKADVAGIGERVDAIGARVDSMDKKFAKKADNDDDLAEQVVADRRADGVSRGEFRLVQEQVNDMRVKQMKRPQADRDVMADLQAKADACYRSLGDGRAPEPMQGEDTVSYAIRLHRPLLKHSKRFKGAELAVIAADPSTFSSVLDSLRADAYEAGLNPVGMQPFQYREIKTESPGGHRITTFVGNGTIFKALSRPAKYVTGIGGDDRRPRSSGGSFRVAQ